MKSVAISINTCRMILLGGLMCAVAGFVHAQSGGGNAGTGAQAGGGMSSGMSSPGSAAPGQSHQKACPEREAPAQRGSRPEWDQAPLKVRAPPEPLRALVDTN